jgi:hypothetical protein
MSDQGLKELALRIERLEKLLDTAPRRTPVEEISAEDMRAYLKVRNAFGEGGACGINETSPCIVLCRQPVTFCRIPQICRICDFECTCGPCAMCSFGGGGIGGGGRFGGLGG